MPVEGQTSHGSGALAAEISTTFVGLLKEHADRGPVHEQRRLRPLFELLIAQLLEVAQTSAARSSGGMLQPRLLLALDEAVAAPDTTAS